ncbi:MAG: DUF4399 domain-containing protein [Gemmatimonadota bacterium]
MVSARTGATLALTFVIGIAAACAEADAPEDMPADSATDAVEEVATVHILEPVDGAEITGSSVRVLLHAEHVTILPAGDTTPGSGHHHLLLNAAAPAEGEAIPVAEGFVHLGQAQTEHTFTDLEPGEYTLVAVIGDLVHRVLPQEPDTVRFTVVPSR